VGTTTARPEPGTGSRTSVRTPSKLANETSEASRSGGEARDSASNLESSFRGLFHASAFMRYEEATHRARVGGEPLTADRLAEPWFLEHGASRATLDQLEALGLPPSPETWGLGFSELERLVDLVGAEPR
jgi:hypothetical protein